MQKQTECICMYMYVYVWRYRSRLSFFSYCISSFTSLLILIHSFLVCAWDVSPTTRTNERCISTRFSSFFSVAGRDFLTEIKTIWNEICIYIYVYCMFKIFFPLNPGIYIIDLPMYLWRKNSEKLIKVRCIFSSQ